MAEVLGRRLAAIWTTRLSPAAGALERRVHAVRDVAYLAVLPGGGIDRLDRRITRWRAAGALLWLHRAGT